jgi:hypothetical protein
MKMNLRHGIWVLAVGVGIAISAGTVHAVAAPLPQDRDREQQQQQQQREQDYSRNKNYQQGMREGRSDSAHHMDHSKKRHYKKDYDNRAYEAGYQKGRGN